MAALAINVQHDRRLQETFMKNQNVLKSLFKSGKQGIAFRGHRDDHIAWFENCDINQGNFIELVRF